MTCVDTVSVKSVVRKGQRRIRTWIWKRNREKNRGAIERARAGELRVRERFRRNGACDSLQSSKGFFANLQTYEQVRSVRKFERRSEQSSSELAVLIADPGYYLTTKNELFKLNLNENFVHTLIYIQIIHNRVFLLQKNVKLSKFAFVHEI